MSEGLRSACDGILQRVATDKDRVPGVVAMITDRSANIYEGATGERSLERQSKKCHCGNSDEDHLSAVRLVQLGRLNRQRGARACARRKTSSENR